MRAELDGDAAEQSIITDIVLKMILLILEETVVNVGKMLLLEARRGWMRIAFDSISADLSMIVH